MFIKLLTYWLELSVSFEASLPLKVNKFGLFNSDVSHR